MEERRKRPDAAAAAAARPAVNKRRKREPLKIGLLGCGAINGTVARMIVDGKAGPAVLKAALVRRERTEDEIRSLFGGGDEATTATVADDVVFTTDPDEFFFDDGPGSDWDLCVEAAGQPAVRAHGKRCLEAGRDLMITSIGSLTDDALLADLSATAEATGTRLILCTGSMPAVDWTGAASLLPAGEEDRAEVRVAQVKPPRAWLGTPAERDHPDLLRLTGPRVLFEGSSREAASRFPKNANVAAMLALATAGLDGTRASLVADPDATGNRVEVTFRGRAGRLRVEVEAAPSETNPRTSAVVALSVVKAVRKLCCPVVVGL